ncbi:MAG: hypothetical protein Satyrvirus4_29 [Satyrvirus sp.]|uniref:Cullin family profile domain-containing protein n=1 Tax=Satyrvirus sp. TaxID=2487771 RepID=A0A3G5AD77_9VIRU|nr:MAG: hypothetical protein Satyrvirus4_29 [Satyrvirus sp.]
MDIINNSTTITAQLKSKPYFDLCMNNSRLGIIICTENNPIFELEKIFDQILADDKCNYGYYELQNLFTYAQMKDPNIVLNSIINIVSKKISTIKDALFDENNSTSTSTSGVTFGMYVQIWKSYKDFYLKLYNLIKNYQRFLVERNIKSGKISHDILSIIQICMFYNGIVGSTNDDILVKVSDGLSHIDKNNIEQLVDYIDSIRAFMIMSEFTKIDRTKLSNIIKNIVNKTTVINAMCSYLNTLLKSLTGHHILNESEYETIDTNDVEKKIIKKIYKVATILSVYCEKTKLLVCYGKFMQARIIDSKYDNLELELEIIKRISGNLGKNDSQKLIDAVADIIGNNDINKTIHNADIKIKSEEYLKLPCISTKIMNPIILTKNMWKIYNISDMDIMYPPELKCYLEIISKCYLNIYNNQYVINWQPTLGSAQFEAQLGSKKISIMCNILQAIALTYMNDNHTTTTTAFGNNTFINLKLAEKIFKSLFEANLVTYAEFTDMDEPLYTVNTQNYTGDNKIDIRQTFIDVFDENSNPNPNDTIPRDLVSYLKDASDLSDIGNDENVDENIIVDESDGSDDGSEPISEPTYQEFIAAELKRQRNKEPGLPNVEYMKRASAEWNKQKKVPQKYDSDTDSEDVPKKAQPTYNPKYSSDTDSGEEMPKKKAPPKYDSDSDDYMLGKKAPMKIAPMKIASTKKHISSYQEFIVAELKRQQNKEPGLSNAEYLKRASTEWNNQKKVPQKYESDIDSEDVPKKAQPTYNPKYSSDTDSEEEMPKKKAPLKYDSDSDDYTLGIKAPMKKAPMKIASTKKHISPYQEFIAAELKRQRDINPGLQNREYMKRAAVEWNKQKSSSTPKLAKPKISYTNFITTELKRQREINPGLVNKEYMKRAAVEWNKLKNGSAANTTNATNSGSDSESDS